MKCNAQAAWARSVCAAPLQRNADFAWFGVAIRPILTPHVLAHALLFGARMGTGIGRVGRKDPVVTPAPAVTPPPPPGPPPVPTDSTQRAPNPTGIARDVQSNAGPNAAPNARAQARGDLQTRAEAVYADYIKRGGRVLMTTSAGNGNKPVLVLVPPGFDPTKPARVHTHYHGNNATVLDPNGSPAGTKQRLEAVQARDPQTVFVLPECSTAPARGPAWYDANWENASSQAQTTADALKAAGINNVGKQIVSAHSRGGSALARIIDRDPSGAGLKADRLELHDSLYGSQDQLARWASTANGKAVSSVIYYHAGNPAGRDAVLAQAYKSQGFQRVEMSQQPPMPRDPPYMRDSHYRTVGEFMDSASGP